MERSQRLRVWCLLFLFTRESNNVGKALKTGCYCNKISVLDTILRREITPDRNSILLRESMSFRSTFTLPQIFQDMSSAKAGKQAAH